MTQSDGSNCHYACAVNLPNGNVGTTTRHGLTSSWLDGSGVVNGTGDDFVIYESASSPTGYEGFMVRLQLADGSFTDWRSEVADGSELYLGETAESAAATGFDLSSFGIGAGEAAFAIQIANLIAADRLQDGFVFFDGATGTPNTFASGARDPDPLYIGILSSLTGETEVPAPGGLPLLAGGLGLMAWRLRGRAARG